MNGSTVAIFGITFKENCPDVRNTKVVDVINELKEYGVRSIVVDPVADKDDLFKEYGIKIHEKEDVKNVDAVVVAVAHDEFKTISWEDIKTCRSRSTITFLRWKK